VDISFGQALRQQFGSLVIASRISWSSSRSGAECVLESSRAVRQGRFQLGVESCAPSFRLLLRWSSVFLWLVLGLEHQVVLLFLTTLFTFWSAPREVFRFWFSPASWESAARVFLISSCSKLDFYFTASRFDCSSGQFASGMSSASRVHVLIQQLGLSCRLVLFTQLSFCSLVFWPPESPSYVSLLRVAASPRFVLSRGSRSCSWATGSKARVFLVLFVLHLWFLFHIHEVFDKMCMR
jgi:hypothetical protein